MSETASAVRASALETATQSGAIDVRMMVLLENPDLIPRISEGGSFGGKESRVAAQSMFGRLPEAIDDVKKKTEVVELAPRTWLIRMPIVNAVAIETDAGVVLIDVGMAPAGPAVLEAVRSVSDKPIHTIIFTHGHVDHAYGAWAIMEAGESSEIIGHELINDRFDRYLLIPGSLSRLMSQPLEM